MPKQMMLCSHRVFHSLCFVSQKRKLCVVNHWRCFPSCYWSKKRFSICMAHPLRIWCLVQYKHGSYLYGLHKVFWHNLIQNKRLITKQLAMPFSSCFYYIMFFGFCQGKMGDFSVSFVIVYTFLIDNFLKFLPYQKQCLDLFHSQLHYALNQ